MSTLNLQTLQADTWKNTANTQEFYKCYAWVNFNGTGTVAIRGSGNVASITDNGVGDYTVNLITAIPDINYTIVASGYLGSLSTEGDITLQHPTTAPTVSSFRIANGVPGTSGSTAFSARDSQYIHVNIFR
jgi:hypothetical protein